MIDSIRFVSHSYRHEFKTCLHVEALHSCRTSWSRRVSWQGFSAIVCTVDLRAPRRNKRMVEMMLLQYLPRARCLMKKSLLLVGGRQDGWICKAFGRRQDWNQRTSTSTSSFLPTKWAFKGTQQQFSLLNCSLNLKQRILFILSVLEDWIQIENELIIVTRFASTKSQLWYAIMTTMTTRLLIFLRSKELSIELMVHSLLRFRLVWVTCILSFLSCWRIKEATRSFDRSLNDIGERNICMLPHRVIYKHHPTF